MRTALFILGVASLACAPMYRRGRPAPICDGPQWSSQTAFTIACHNVVFEKDRQNQVPLAVLVKAAQASLLAEADQFYVEDARFDQNGTALRVKGVALKTPDQVRPPGKPVLSTSLYVSPAEADAIKLQAREIRCQRIMGDAAFPEDQRVACGQLLAWREQVRLREAQEHLAEQQRQQQLAIEAEAEAQARRERTAAVLGALAGAGRAGGDGAPGLATVGTGGRELLIFGGDGHKTFLGCLSCSEYSSDSVLNEYGSYGNEYRSDSIFNKYGRFGSDYSTHSACNTSASDPPVIVDRQGNYYGRLTLNSYKDQTRLGDVIAWLAGVCRD